MKQTNSNYGLLGIEQPDNAVMARTRREVSGRVSLVVRRVWPCAGGEERPGDVKVVVPRGAVQGGVSDSVLHIHSGSLFMTGRGKSAGRA